MKQVMGILAAVMVIAGRTPTPSSARTATTDITGRWRYNATGLVMNGQSCAMKNVIFVLRQSGQEVSGRSLGGSVVCNGKSEAMTPAALDSGSAIAGDSIHFALGPNTHRGKIIGDSIVGRVDIAQPKMSGTFVMIKAK